MKLRCPYCKTAFEKLEKPACPSCGHALRMVWEGDLSTPKARASFRAGRPRRPNTEPRQRAKMPMRPSPMMLPWLVLSYRSRIFVWTLVLATVIVGKMLFTHSVGIPLLPDERRASENRCRRELLALRTGLEWFRAHCKRYPTDAEGLAALVRDPGVPGWHGNYIDQLASDPWGHPYLYACTNLTLRLASTGADGRAGTGDDIASPEPDWRALLERIDIKSLPHAPAEPAPAAAITNRP